MLILDHPSLDKSDLNHIIHRIKGAGYNKLRHYKQIYPAPFIRPLLLMRVKFQMWLKQNTGLNTIPWPKKT